MRNLLIIAALLGISACGSVGQGLEDFRASGEQNIGLCPNIFALDDAARMIEFDGEEKLENVAWSAEIVDVRTSCRYVDDRPIRAIVEVDFAVGRGPAAASSTTDISYFVAVTRRNRALIDKEEYVVPVKVKDGLATVRFTENVQHIVIPRKDEATSGSNFEIAVGFSLDRSQLIFNRSGQSLKFPEL